MMYAGFTENSW
jgi:N-acylethanolamine-hydrolysing acid amidase